MNGLTDKEELTFQRVRYMIERGDNFKAIPLLAEYPKLVNYPATINTAISFGNIEMARHLVGLGVRCTNDDLKLAQLRYDETNKEKGFEYGYLKIGALEMLNFIKKCRDVEQKKIQEAHETNIAALNSTKLGQKLPEDVIRKISEYGGRKTRKGKGKKRRASKRTKRIRAG